MTTTNTLQRTIPGLLAMAVIMNGCTAAALEPPAAPQRRGYDHVAQRLTEQIQDVMDEHDLPSLTVALVDDQRVVWTRAFGYADVENETPATPATVYRVGSLSKLFTATAVMQLADQGRLDIDQPLQRYLPEFSIRSRFANADPITPRNVMDHHSGLPTNHWDGFWSNRPFQQQVRQLKNEYAAYPPNYVFCYSNIGFNLLGTMIEGVTGNAFAPHMQTALLDPMGMAHSSFRLDGRVAAHLAKGYRAGRASPQPPIRDVPAGGLYSTADDLARFVQTVFAGGRTNGDRVLSERSTREMLTVQNQDVGLDLNVHTGLGWFVRQSRTEAVGTIASHSGGTRLFSSRVAMLPEHKLGVILLTNTGNAQGALRGISHKALELALEAKAGIGPAPAAQEPEVAPKVTLSEAELDAYTGTYYTAEMGLVQVRVRDERLYADARGKTLELTPHADGRFSMTYRLLGFIPIKRFFGNDLRGVYMSLRNIGDHAVLLLHENGRTRRYGYRIPVDPIPPAWQARIGPLTLIGEDPGWNLHAAELERRHGVLALRAESDHGLLFSPLRAIGDRQAVVLGLGTGRGDTVWVDTTHGKERLHFAGLVFEVGTQ